MQYKHAVSCRVNQVCQLKLQWVGLGHLQGQLLLPHNVGPGPDN